MSLYVYNSSAWKQVQILYVKNNGVWQRVYSLWVKNNNTWQKIFPLPGTITFTANATWTVPQYNKMTIQVYAGGAGGGGGGANDGFSYGSWGGQGGFGGQTIFAFGSTAPINAYGGIGGGGGGDLGQGGQLGTPGGGSYLTYTYGVAHAGGSTAGAPQGSVGGQSLFANQPAPNPISLNIPNGQIVANGGGNGGAAGNGSGNGGTIGGVGGNGGYVTLTYNIGDTNAPVPFSSVSIVVGGAGGGGGGAYDSGAQGAPGSSGSQGQVVVNWS